MIDHWPRTSQFDFGFDPSPDLDPGWIFPFLQHRKMGHFRHYIGLLRKLWMNVHKISGRDGPSDKKYSFGVWDCHDLFPIRIIIRICIQD